MGHVRFLLDKRVLPTFLIIASCLGIPEWAARGQSRARPLITRPVDESSVTMLKGNVHPLARPQLDRGPVPVSLPAHRQLLILKRTPQQEMTLQQFLSSLQDRNSPNFRRFLTPEQFGQQYGPAPEDVAQIVSWLNGQGFSVTRVAKSNMAIEFSGSVAQLESAFHTEIHRFMIGAQEHVANVSNPMIPSALAPVVAGVSPLNDFFPRPQVIRGASGQWDSSEKRFVPQLTLTASGTPYFWVGPGDAATIYDAPTTFNAQLKAGQATYYGNGVTIGIVTNGGVNVFNVANYRALFQLPATTFSIVTDGTAPGGDADNTESTLDGEIAGGIATGAKIVYYQAADTTLQSGVMLAILRAIDDNAVNILNVSYGGCEQAQGAAGNQEILNAWEQAAAQGIAVTVSSGDSGSAGCDNPNTETVASQGFGVNGLASTPYTVAVGGTDFDALPGSFAKYVNSTNGAYYTSALSYIPENPWNDSTASNGSSASNRAYRDSKGNTNIVAGGGGASSAGLYDAAGSALGGYAKPLWQRQYETSAGIAADSVRDVPDLSLFAANGMYRAVWATCGNNDCSGANPTISGVGGTSASAPAFAGVLALINQKIGANERLGQPNWILYDLAKNHPEIFHQIPSGNNSVGCTPGTANCAANNFLSGYNAAASYNLATGLGSVDISSLVNNWTSIAKTQTTTSLTLNPVTFQHGTPVAIGIGVSPSSATGSVALSSGKSSSSISFQLSGGQATGNWPGLPGGTYDVYANYGGDGNYGGSISAPTQVTVTPEDSILQLSVTAADSHGKLTSLAGGAVPYGTYISVDAQPIGKSQSSNPTPIQNATGGVSFVDTNPYPGSGGGILDATGNAELPSHYNFQAGPHSITASYGGDNSYNSSTSPSVTFTVQKAGTTTSMSADAKTIFAGSVNVSANINPTTPQYYGQLLDGQTTFTDKTTGAVLGTATYIDSLVNTSTGLLYGQAMLSVQASQLVLGDNNIVATYGGGINFTSSTASTPVVINCTAGCGNGTGEFLELAFFASTPQSHIISRGTTSTTPVEVSGFGGFTGAVNLTCSVTGTRSSDVSAPQCSFNPATVTITGAIGVNSTITVTTTAFGKSAAVVSGSRALLAVRGCLIFACFILAGLPGRRRSLALLRAVMCAVLLGGIAACGGGNGTKTPPGGGGAVSPGTTPDLYTITFHAADAATGTLTAQDYFTLSVN
jgi:pro-kumamolisin-like protein/Big-like domain-containing protein